MEPNPRIRKHFIQNRKRLRLYIETLISNPDDAADLLQELGLVVLAHAAAPSDARKLLAWYRGIARHLASHHWRSTRRDRQVFAHGEPDPVEYESSSTSVEDLLAWRSSLTTCLGDLDEHSRDLLRRYLDGKTSDEIARELHRSPAAVRMKIMRLRSIIKEKLKTGLPS